MATQYQILNPNALKQYKSGSTTTLSDGRVILKDGITPIEGTYKTVSDTPAYGYGVYQPQTSTMNSATLATGVTAPNVGNMLEDTSSSNQALKVYNENMLSDVTKNSAEIQKQIDAMKAAQLKEAQAREQEANQKITDYNTAFQPAIDAFKSNLSNQTTAINSVYTPEYYTSLLNDKKTIVDEMIGYSKLLDGALNDVSMPSLVSVASGRRNSVIADYQARINVKNAALSAIDGNFSLASSILDNGVSKLDDYYTKQINFQKLAQDIFKTSDVKDLTNQAITDLQAKQKTLEETKTIIQNLMSDPATALVANKAGILLTDTAEEVATKLNNFYVKNPGYAPDNIATNKSLMQKYPDAGINLNDLPNVVKSKLANSQLYKKSIAGNYSFETDPETGITTIRNNDTGEVTTSEIKNTGQIGGQCGDYVHNIMNNTPKFGDTWEEKQSAMNVTPQQFMSSPQVGDIVTFKTNLPYGHVAVVTSINGDNFTVTESNWNLDERVTNGRVIKLNDQNILGAYRGATFKESVKTKSQIANEQKQAEFEKQKEDALAVKQTALDLINDLKNSPAIGYSTGLMSAWSNVPGTEAYYFAQKYKSLRDLLAMGNISKLKGAMSDKDIEFLRNSATSLKLGLSAKDFTSELDKLTFKLNNPTSSTQNILDNNDPLGINSNNDPLGLGI